MEWCRKNSNRVVISGISASCINRLTCFRPLKGSDYLLALELFFKKGSGVSLVIILLQRIKNLFLNLNWVGQSNVVFR